MKSFNKTIVLFVIAVMLITMWAPMNSDAAEGDDDYYITTVGSFNNWGVGTTSVATDSDGNLYYIERSMGKVHKFDAVTGIVSTVAGGGDATSTPDGTQDATSVQLFHLNYVEFYNDHLYISEGTRVLKVDAAGKIDQVWSHNDFVPSALAFDSDNNLYIAVEIGSAPQVSRVVLKIDNEDNTACRFAGTVHYTHNDMVPGACGSNSPALGNSLKDIAFDGDNGLLYIADGDIKRVASDGTMQTVYNKYPGGSGVEGITLDRNGNLYFSTIRIFDNRIYKIAASEIGVTTKNATVIAGDGNAAGDGVPAKDAKITDPKSIVVDNKYGTIYVALNSGVIRAINKAYKVEFADNDSDSGAAPNTVIKLIGGNMNITIPVSTGNLQKTGHKFLGWNTSEDGTGTNYSPGSSYTVTGNVTLHANWKPEQYTLTYTAGGNGTISGNLTQTVEHGKSGTEVVAIPNTGYVFAGWDDGETNAARTDTNVQGSISAIANFKKEEYTVGFNSNGGSAVSNQQVEYNDLAVEPDNPALYGNSFEGWYSDSGLNTKFDFSNTPITTSITLYAKWKPNEYTLTYTAGSNGTINGTVTQNVYHGSDGAEVIAIPDTDYLFVEWSDGEPNAARKDTNVQGPINVTAQFAPANVVVSFDTNGAGTINSQSLSYKTLATVPIEPIRAGFTFGGWYSDANFYNPFDFDTPITGDITLYAKWTTNLTYIAGTGGTIDGATVQSVVYGMDGTTVTAVPNTGYVFAGWDDGEPNAVRTDTNVQGPINVTASFDKEVYTVSFDSNGGSAVAEQQIKYNELANEPESYPALDGYSFEGWYSDSDLNTKFDFGNTPITDDTTLYAKWRILPPGAPSVQTPIPGNGTVTLTWSADSTATGYNIYQSTTPGVYSETPAATVTSSVYSHQFTGLTNGTQYYFVVSAVNDGGEVMSNEESATPRTIPQAPTNVTATAGNGAATISFTPPTNSGGSPITGFKLIWSTGSMTVSGTATSATITGLTNGTSYTFTVQAINVAGNSLESTASNVVTPVAPTTGGGGGGTPTPGDGGTPAPGDNTPTPGDGDTPAESDTTDSESNSEAEQHVFDERKIDVQELLSKLENRVLNALQAKESVGLADVKGHWAENTMDHFVKLGIINGFVDGTFRPNNEITRGEFAAIIARIFTFKQADHSIELQDIENHWAKDAIGMLAKAGIIGGYGDGTFRPNQNISREELVVIISRIVNLQKLDKDPTRGKFTDMSDAGSFAVDVIKETAQAGIINGEDNNRFDPKGVATRAEALTIIMNVFQLDPKVKELLGQLQ